MEPLPTKTLGQRVRELRQKADLALRDLGEKMKDPVTGTPVSPAFLSDIENGRRFPSDDMIDKLAQVLGADAMELRRCDPRGPAKEIQDLAVMNAQYAFAFRRAVDFVHDNKLSPQEFIRRVEDDRAAIILRKIEKTLGRTLFPEEFEGFLRYLAKNPIPDAPTPPAPPTSAADHEQET